jgi:hypothetical protein
MLPTLSTPRKISPNLTRTGAPTISSLSSPKFPSDEADVQPSQSVRFASDTIPKLKQTLGPLHTGKALVKRLTPRFPKRVKTTDVSSLEISQGIVGLDIDTTLLPDERIDPKVLKINEVPFDVDLERLNP